MALRIRARFCARARPSSGFGAFGQRMRIDTPRTMAETGGTHARVLWRKGSLPMSVRADRSDVFQRHGDAVTGGRAGAGVVDRVAAILEGHTVAGSSAADEIALLEKRPVVGVEVELQVRAHAIGE